MADGCCQEMCMKRNNRVSHGSVLSLKQSLAIKTKRQIKNSAKNRAQGRMIGNQSITDRAGIKNQRIKGVGESQESMQRNKAW